MFKEKKIFSKSAIGALLFAIALWGYTALNGEYLTTVTVPLNIDLPDDRALESKIPNDLIVEVRGSGWNLFNLIFFNTSKSCEVDLRNETVKSDYTVRRQVLVNSVRYLNNVEPRDVIPTNIELKTGQILEKEILVRSNLILEPKDGFLVSGEIKIEPEKIKIKGNQNLLNQISEWKTKNLKLQELTNDFNQTVELSDTLEGIVELNPSEVLVSADIQQIAEINVPDVPIKIVGGRLPSDHKLSSMMIKVSLRGGIKEIENFNSEDLKVTLYLSSIISGKEFVIPKIETGNKNIKVLGSDPQYIYILRIRNLLAKN